MAKRVKEAKRERMINQTITMTVSNLKVPINDCEAPHTHTNINSINTSEVHKTSHFFYSYMQHRFYTLFQKMNYFEIF